MRRLWTLELNNALTAPPAFDATSVYAPIEGNRMVAYDLTSGTLRWIAPLGTSLEPTAGGGLVFVADLHAVTAIDAATGAQVWLMPLADRVSLPLVWNNGWLLAATTSGEVLAFRATDGHLLWRRDIGSPAHARPAVSGDRVYVSADDGRVIALPIDGGPPLWERRLGGAPSDILAFDDELFVGSTDRVLYCLETTTGREIWHWRTGADVIGLPAVDERTVYFVSLDNVLRGLNRSSGVQRWQRPLPLRPTVGPLKLDDSIIVSGLDPLLRAYSARTGGAAGELSTAGDMVGPPHIFENPKARRTELIVVTRDIAKGASVVSLATETEPKPVPLAPLPNAVTIPVPAGGLPAAPPADGAEKPVQKIKSGSSEGTP